MPELPDVEVFKRYVDATSLHKKISDIRLSSKKMLDQISSNDLRDALLNHSFSDTFRHGKYLFIHNDDEQWLVLHFGMTGFVKYFKDTQDQPSHTRLLLSFKNSYHFAVHSQRLLGKISITDSKQEYIQRQDLGDDALRISLSDFIDLLHDRRGMVKSTLMNQSIIAGIGNIYADEICFQTGIHPKTKMNHLEKNVLEQLYHDMNHIFDVAVDAKVNVEQFPDSFIIPKRLKNGICPKCEQPLRTIKVNNRTTYFCPVHQQKR